MILPSKCIFSNYVFDRCCWAFSRGTNKGVRRSITFFFKFMIVIVVVLMEGNVSKNSEIKCYIKGVMKKKVL